MNFATDSLVCGRAHTHFFAKHPNGRSCVIMPFVGQERVRVQFLYDLHNAGLRATFVGLQWQDIEVDWRMYCRAFVDFKLDPTMSLWPIAIAFDGTVRARNELQKTPFAYPATLEEINAALGTRLDSVGVRNAVLEEMHYG